ncbi:uncharacterized protein DEA37_0014218 [Paragonimus westermani]|uniref:Uncharacterized protein n=1 Tax=Paragonimus westermani TaxID=34504 RepID=A0A5J4NMX4_9TREM|nr:uncharacterized protein DEA37_0014218 [Paragonimus westermani]
MRAHFLLSNLSSPRSRIPLLPLKKENDFTHIDVSLRFTVSDYAMSNLTVCALLVLIGLVQLFALQVPYKRRAASVTLSTQVDDRPIVPESDVSELPDPSILQATEISSSVSLHYPDVDKPFF